MGKVGSTSISSSLKKNGVRSVFHIHRLDPGNIDHININFRKMNRKLSSVRIGKLLHRQITEMDQKAKIITLVRDPISRNISAFFANLINYIPDTTINSYNLDVYTKIFIEKYPHHVPLEWFDKEPKETLGIDVFSHPFPRDEGYLHITNGNIDWLIMKSEIDDLKKQKELQNFLDIKEINLLNKNVATAKDYASTYQHFKKNLRLPRVIYSKYEKFKIFTTFLYKRRT